MNTDRELIERIRTGNEAAFNTLFDRHADRVRRRAMGIVRDAAAAEDLVQEVFLRVWTRADQWRGTGSAGGWILRTATNLALNHLRSAKRRPGMPGDAGWAQAAEQEVADRAAPGPDAMLEQAEQLAAMRRLVDDLPARHREVIRLVHEFDVNVQDAADRLDIPAGTVKSRLHYARAALAQEWDTLREDYE